MQVSFAGCAGGLHGLVTPGGKLSDYNDLRQLTDAGLCAGDFEFAVEPRVNFLETL